MWESLQDKFTRLIRWSEKYTNVDMTYVVKGSFWLMVGQIAHSGLTLVLVLVLANVVSQETYGLYQYAISLMAIFSVFTLPGTLTALTRAIARGYEETLPAVTGVRLKGAFIGSIVALCAVLYYVLKHNYSLALLLGIVAVFLPMYETYTTYGSFFSGRRDFKSGSIATSIVQSASTVVLIIVALLAPNSVPALIIAYFGSYTIMQYLVYRYTKKRIAAGSGVDPQAVNYGMHLSAINIVGTVVGNLDNVILFHFLGPAEIAIYSIVTGAPNQIKFVLGFVDALIFPRMAKYTDAEVRKTMWRKFMLSGLAGCILVAVYIVAAQFLFPLLFPKYAGAVFLSQLFSLSMLNAAIAPAGTYLAAMAKVREQYWSNTVSYAFQLVAMIVCTVLWGLLGMIIARILTRFFTAFAYFYFYLRPLTPPEV